MKNLTKTFSLTCILIFMVVNSSIVMAGGSVINQSFNYQGQLLDNGSPANGNYDITVSAFFFASGGVVQGQVSFHLNTPVTNGLFTLDSVDVVDPVGVDPLDGLEVFLEVAVRPAGEGSYAALSPRQRIKAVPYANNMSRKEAVAGQVLTYDGNGYWEPETITQTPWSIDGSDIFYTDGNVGVGTDSPTETLTVDGDTFHKGNVYQNLNDNGGLKYMVKATCGMTGSAIISSYTGTLGSTLGPSFPVTVANGANAGRCSLTFPTLVFERYWVASPVTDANRSTNCVISGNSATLNCRSYTPNTGTGITSDITVLIY